MIVLLKRMALPKGGALLIFHNTMGVKITMFNHLNGVSPVNQDFVWVAEYYDGSSLSEFDFGTHEENSFYEIDRNKLIRFGLVGLGHKLYFENVGGTFKIMGRAFDFVYSANGKNYPLTGLASRYYNDIITYKSAESSIALGDGHSGSTINRITQFNFGYKAKLELDDVQFNVQIICEMPCNEPMRFNIKLVADQDLDGKLMIIRNYAVCDEFAAPLTKDIGGELNWLMK